MKYKEVFVFWIRIILGFPDSNPKRSKIEISEIRIRSRFLRHGSEVLDLYQ